LVTASECVREVFPKSSILPNRTDNDLWVVVSAQMDASKMVEVWSGDQKDLYSKYHQRRTKSMEEIKACLRRLQLQEEEKEVR